MIHALMLYTILAVEISGQNIQEFSDSLEEFRNQIAPCDREFDPTRKAWVVKNVEKYVHIPWVKRAIEDRQHQPTLF